MAPGIVEDNPRYRQDKWGGEMWHLDGVPWWEAKPRRWHRHRAHSVGYLAHFRLVYRCGCGAIREPGADYPGWVKT